MKPVPGILDIAPYVGGRAEARGPRARPQTLGERIAAGPSRQGDRSLQGRVRRACTSIPKAARPTCARRIGEAFGLNADRIVCGNGSDELLHLLPQIYAGPGDEVLYSEHGFLVYKIAALAASAMPVAVPEPDLVTDVDALLARATAKTKIVFVANPNNPTGSYNTAADLRRLRAGLPNDCLLVIDAAYAEYVSRNDYDSGIELAATTENTVMTRTFSKIYGLAALRVGWAYGPAPVIDALNRIRGPFNVSTRRPSRRRRRDRATALMSNAPPRTTRSGCRGSPSASRRTGLKVRPASATSCSSISSHGRQDRGRRPTTFLMQRGVILRGVAAYGLPNCLRITVGTEEATKPRSSPRSKNS